MQKMTIKKITLPFLLATLAIGCSSQKPQALLNAEESLQSAANNPYILKHARNELNIANKTLLTASTAESEEEMLSIAFIADTQIKTAVNTAIEHKAIQSNKELSQQKDLLIALSNKAKKEDAQRELVKMQELQELKAEKEISLAFGQIKFVAGKSELVSGTATGVDLLANYLHKSPEKSVSLASHTDSSGSSQLNQTLSQQRADYIRDILITKGVSSKNITSIGYGESLPIANNSTKFGRQQNRRITLGFK